MLYVYHICYNAQWKVCLPFGYNHSTQWDPEGTHKFTFSSAELSMLRGEATPHAKTSVSNSPARSEDQLQPFTLTLIMISNIVNGDVRVASVPSCTFRYYSQSMLFQRFLFHLPLSVLTPLLSDGEVPQEVAEHTFLTESLFKLNLNDPLSS